MEREDIYEEKLTFQKNLLKISFQQNFEFSKSVEQFKSYNISLLCTKKKFKNNQDVCWLEHDYMEMKMIVRDQSKNYFHLTLKIGPLWDGGSGQAGQKPIF